MAISRSKTATAIALFLTLTMAITLVALPSTNAQTGYRTKKTYAVCGLLPNPVGIGQEVLIWVGITDYVQNPTDGWVGLSITIERPDGKTDTIKDIKTDSTGGTGYVYVPDMAGKYYVQTHFPAQWFNWTAPPMFDPEVYGNIWYEASDSEKLELIVQEEQVPSYPTTPLPTEYWTRPINAQHYTWNTISANWLSRPDNAYAANNDNAPETGHILWAKPLSLGGLAGGFLGEHNYETGDAYEGKWSASVVINGILYYNRYAQGFAGGWYQQGIYAVDLRTGEELWFKNSSRLAFGQTFYWDSFNMHGVFAYIYETVTSYPYGPFAPGITTWKAYDPLTGEYQFSISPIPTGGAMFGASYTLTGPHGEIIIYNIDLAHGWVAKWNSTTAVLNGGPMGPATGMSLGSWGSAANTQYTFNGSQGYDWNITISAGPGNLPGSVAKILPDRVLGCTASGWTSIGETPIVNWAFSLKPASDGKLPLLYNVTWQPPTGMLSMSFGDASNESKVFTIEAKETRQIWGFSTENGQKMWGPTSSQALLQVYGMTGGIAYGRLFSTGYGGILYCYNVTTGDLLWEYRANDTYNEILWSNEWPIFIAFIADGKVYLQSNEHSPTNPLARGSPFVCIDVETGERVWELPIWGTSWGGAPIIADSIIAQFNSYDNRIYAIGMGPTTTTATAPDIGITFGSSVMIRGTVTDQSAGAKDTPAISDESMDDWMKYLYMQFPRPENAIGVEVTIDVLDANGNYRNIGTTTSDASGVYGFAWEPDIPGTYQVFATFAGSKSYWPSYAVTYFTVEEAPEATPGPTPTPAPMTDTYLFGATAGIIVAIAAVGLVLVLMLRKR
jgi:outer membrane protein assembly factor BamB